MIIVIVVLIAAVVLVSVVVLGSSVRIVKQFERGVVFRFGRVVEGTTRGPGIALLLPFADRMEKVNMQIVTMPVPAQDGITRDNVTVRVDAVIYFRVVDPVRVAVDVQDFLAAVGQLAQTSLRSISGQRDLDDLLSNREKLDQGMELMIDSPVVDWGLPIDRVEIKDVTLPKSMKRSMSRQAEAERERRARVIIAGGEKQAATKLTEAADTMAESPAALQLRLLETVVEVAAEKNSTLVLPFPVELLRFLERTTPAEPARGDATSPDVPAAALSSTAPPVGGPLDRAPGGRPHPGYRGADPTPDPGGGVPRPRGRRTSRRGGRARPRRYEMGPTGRRTDHSTPGDAGQTVPLCSSQPEAIWTRPRCHATTEAIRRRHPWHEAVRT